MHHVLLVDDDERLGPPLAAYFARHGMQLAHVCHPADGLRRLQAGGVDLVILDVMLPDTDGYELCRQIRRDRQLRELPVIMLSARGDVVDRVVGLELGADDYVPKPFEPRELAARVQTVLRRTSRGAAGADDWATRAPLIFEGLEVDLARQQVLRQGEALTLTSTEFRLLVLLAEAPGRVFSRDDILNHPRGHDAELYTRAVDIVVSRLRKKLAPLDCIRTRRNAGYLLALPRLAADAGHDAGAGLS